MPTLRVLRIASLLLAACGIGVAEKWNDEKEGWPSCDKKGCANWPTCSRTDGKPQPAASPKRLPEEAFDFIRVEGGKLVIVPDQKSPPKRSKKVWTVLESDTTDDIHIIAFFGMQKTGKSTLASKLFCAMNTNGKSEYIHFKGEREGVGAHHTSGVQMSGLLSYAGHQGADEKKYMFLDLQGLGGLHWEDPMASDSAILKMIALLSEVVSVFVYTTQKELLTAVDLNLIGNALQTTRTNLIASGSKGDGEGKIKSDKVAKADGEIDATAHAMLFVSYRDVAVNVVMPDEFAVNKVKNDATAMQQFATFERASAENGFSALLKQNFQPHRTEFLDWIIDLKDVSDLGLELEKSKDVDSGVDIWKVKNAPTGELGIWNMKVGKTSPAKAVKVGDQVVKVEIPKGDAKSEAVPLQETLIATGSVKLIMRRKEAATVPFVLSPVPQLTDNKDLGLRKGITDKYNWIGFSVSSNGDVCADYEYMGDENLKCYGDDPSDNTPFPNSPPVYKAAVDTMARQIFEEAPSRSSSGSAGGKEKLTGKRLVQYLRTAVQEMNSLLPLEEGGIWAKLREENCMRVVKAKAEEILGDGPEGALTKIPQAEFGKEEDVWKDSVQVWDAWLEALLDKDGPFFGAAATCRQHGDTEKEAWDIKKGGAVATSKLRALEAQGILSDVCNKAVVAEAERRFGPKTGVIQQMQKDPEADFKILKKTGIEEWNKWVADFLKADGQYASVAAKCQEKADNEKGNWAIKIEKAISDKEMQALRDANFQKSLPLFAVVIVIGIVVLSYVARFFEQFVSVLRCICPCLPCFRRSGGNDNNSPNSAGRTHTQGRKRDKKRDVESGGSLELSGISRDMSGFKNDTEVAMRMQALEQCVVSLTNQLAAANTSSSGAGASSSASSAAAPDLAKGGNKTAPLMGAQAAAKAGTKKK